MELLKLLAGKLSPYKKYFWLALVLLIAGLFITIWQMRARICDLRIENDRVQSNNINLMAENRQITTLNLKYREIQGSLRLELDSLAELLKVKPRTITQFVDRVIIQIDTELIEVPVYILGKNQWKIEDSEDCFVWQGVANLTDDSLNVKRTGFSYQNTITDIYYFQRNKFLGLKIGRKKNYHEVRPTCGTVTVKEISIVKK